MGIEIRFLDFLQTLHHPILDLFMTIVTKLGDKGIVWILMSLILLIIPVTRKTGCMMLTALIIFHISCNIILKPLIARPRPYTVNPSIHLLVEALKDYSFPSGHTAASFASVYILYKRKMQKLFWPSLILAVLIAFSRLYLYVHFPTDVIAGILIGLLCGWLGYNMVNQIEKRRQDKKITDKKIT